MMNDEQSNSNEAKRITEVERLTKETERLTIEVTRLAFGAEIEVLGFKSQIALLEIEALQRTKEYEENELQRIEEYTEKMEDVTETGRRSLEVLVEVLKAMGTRFGDHSCGTWTGVSLQKFLFRAATVFRRSLTNKEPDFNLAKDLPDFPEPE